MAERPNVNELVAQLRDEAIHGGMPLGRSFACAAMADLLEQLCSAGDDVARALASFADPDDAEVLERWGRVRRG